MPALSEKYQYIAAFIVFGKYGAALDMLKTIDEPRARELEAEINVLVGDKPATEPKRPPGLNPQKAKHA